MLLLIKNQKERASSSQFPTLNSLITFLTLNSIIFSLFHYRLYMLIYYYNYQNNGYTYYIFNVTDIIIVHYIRD